MLTVDFYDTSAFRRVNMRKISQRLTKQVYRQTDRLTKGCNWRRRTEPKQKTTVILSRIQQITYIHTKSDNCSKRTKSNTTITIDHNEVKQTDLILTTAHASTQHTSQTHKTYAATWQQCSFYKYFKHFKNWIIATQRGNKWGNPWWWS